ncbi:nitroreductase [Falsihalocynthiibacter sp. S25ZX9]|uniref:nitroreductase family protein n=1 Tax=Falsihalocynthiibacter sp. S25ZX9 TaxID=3240870 RepID=UPI003510C150
MPKPNPAAMEFLLSRRSRPSKTLTFPIPSAQDLHPILTAAARTPDHGKLEPWRFIVLADAALPRLAELTDQRGAALGLDDEKRAKSKAQFATAGLVVAVVSSPKPSEKVPYLEQVYSAGAVCLALVNAALASGWGANWLTGWMAYDPEILTEGLGLGEGETVAGFIHLGTETSMPPDRPRPDLAAITTWVTE